MILTMNTFKCNDEFHVRTHGTAMETEMALEYTNLFKGKFEKRALEGAKIKPRHVWWRNLDDIFTITWTGTEDGVKKFIYYLNYLHVTIKFTSEHSSSLVAFP